MKAAVLHRPGEICVEEIPVPTVGRGDALIKVRAASICGTDLRIFRHGHFKLPEGQHRVLGHEIAGVVVEIGADVSTLAVGDRVTVTPNVGCGHCTQCRRGLNNMCPDYDAFGITLDGGFAEYMLVPAAAIARGNVFDLPDDMTFEDAALVEPFSCCVRGQAALRVGVDDTVVVIGAGPIGLFHVMLAKLAGARKVIVSNRTAPRLEAAKQAGADVLVEAQREDLPAIVAAQTSGEGADVVITCVSDPAIQSQAVDLLGTHGRVNFFAGLGKGVSVPIDTNKLHYRGLELTGTTGSSNADYERALRLVGDKRVGFQGIVSRTFAIDDIRTAFDHASSGAGMKAMVVFDDVHQGATS